MERHVLGPRSGGRERGQHQLPSSSAIRAAKQQAGAGPVTAEAIAIGIGSGERSFSGLSSYQQKGWRTVCLFHRPESDDLQAFVQPPETVDGALAIRSYRCSHISSKRQKRMFVFSKHVIAGVNVYDFSSNVYVLSR